MTIPERYEFNGAPHTANEVAAMLPRLYSLQWIRRALQSGCTCPADLAQRYAENLARQKANRLQMAGQFHFGQRRG